MDCFIGPNGEFFQGGDMPYGGRPATHEEIAAHLALTPVPAAVTPLQARLALSRAGLLDQVNAAASAAGAEVELAWYFAKSVERSSTFVASLAGALNITDEQIDDLFRSAATFVN